MPFSAAEQLKKDWCANGTKVKFSVNFGLEHVSLAIAEAPGVYPYFEDRFNGWFAPPNSCSAP